MSNPTLEQLQLLREMARLGGESIVRHHRCHSAYAALETAGLVKAFALSKHEVRYRMTSSGRTVLEERSSLAH